MISKYYKYKNLFYFFNILLFCFFYSEAVSSEAAEGDSGSPSTHMPFKVGFEFQEIGGLCPWALHDITVQRKPLFGYPSPTGKGFLWHVVIDTNDIEFVTSPYKREEKSFLQICLDTLLHAFQVLKANLETKGSITFSEWTVGIPSVFLFTETYRLVYDKPIIKPPKWVPTFSPQVTIQHPLEWTIPLYYALFGFNESPNMLTFGGSLPYRDSILKAAKEGDSVQSHTLLANEGKKINGLVFLHALTLLSMSPMEEVEAGKALEETMGSLSASHQIDAKMKLTLMSRRPFSAMYKDIKADMLVTYEEYFKESILSFNKDFTSVYEVPRFFHLTNYGEQFFDPTTRFTKSLEGLVAPSLFVEDFLPKHESLIRLLLSQGVMTTTMLRHTALWGDLFPSYFERALNLSASSYPRHDLDVSGAPETLVVTRESTHDVLSPPWFLGPEDSMGKFKEVISDEDTKYGEAIIEVRGIRGVGPWFLKKASLEGFSEPKNFLVNPEKIILESLSLFDFLSSFTQAYFSDIYLGVSHAL
jgi:hypothetical protein